MNPVLLKPGGERSSQVVVLGETTGEVSALSLPGDGRPRWREVVARVAGRPAEPRTTSSSARAPAARPRSTCAAPTSPTWGWPAPRTCPCVVVGDIDRGGVFAVDVRHASRCSSPADQALVAGFVVNKFRGDPALLAPGLDDAARAHRPARVRRAALARPACGSTSRTRSTSSPTAASPLPPLGADVLRVAVVRLPRMSNVTDVDALAAEPGVARALRDPPGGVRRRRPRRAARDPRHRRRPGLAAGARARRRARPPGPRPAARCSASAAATRCSGRASTTTVESRRRSGRRPRAAAAVASVRRRPGARAARPARARRLPGRRLRDPPRPHRRRRRRAAGLHRPRFRWGPRGLPRRRDLGHHLARAARERRVPPPLPRRGGRPPPAGTFTGGTSSSPRVRQARLDALGDLVESALDVDALLELAAPDRPPTCLSSRPGHPNPTGRRMMILLLSHADTELLAAAACRRTVPRRQPGPGRARRAPRAAGGRRRRRRAAAGRSVVVADGLDEALRRHGVPVVVLGGEAAPDAELQALSTAPAGVVTEALGYLAEGGPANLANLARFLSDTLLLTGHGFEPPRRCRASGCTGRPHASAGPADGRRRLLPRARAQRQRRVRRRARRRRSRRPGGNARPVFVARCRGARSTTVYALLDGGRRPRRDRAGRRRCARRDRVGRRGRDVGRRGARRARRAGGAGAVPHLEPAAWAESDAGSRPMDAAMQVAIPEFDGRLVTVPFSFKEVGADGLSASTSPTRSGRRGSPGIAVRHALLRSVPNAEKKVALVLSSYPTKHARVGNAVGLDTPASAVLLLQAMREAGYDLGPASVPRGRRRADPHADRRGRSRRRVAHRGAARGATRRGCRCATTSGWFDALPDELRDGMPRALGRGARRAVRRRRRDRRARCLQFGNVRAGDPAAARVRREPDRDLPRPGAAAAHHYLAAYRWLDQVVRRRRGRPPRQARHARVAARQGARLSARCAPDAVLGDAAAGLPVHRQRPGRGHAGQAPRPRHHHRPPGAADGARRHLRRAGQARAAARRARHRRSRWTRASCRRSGRRSGR